MSLIQLLLLGVGYKMLTSKQNATSAAAPAATQTSPEGVVESGLVTPVHSAEDWSGDRGRRMHALSRQALSVDDTGDNGLSILEDYYSDGALPAESDPLNVGPREARLARASSAAKRYIDGERQADRKIYEAEVQAEYYDAEDASPDEVVRYKLAADKRKAKELANEHMLARRARNLAMDSDAFVARDNELRSMNHGKMLARSIKQNIDPNLDQAFQQPRSAQAKRGFTKSPDLPFVDAQPVSLREGNFSQSEILPAEDFDNNLYANDLGFRDWPKFSQQKSPASDFSGILVNEAGSPDFSQTMVEDVKEDFGGRR